MARQTMVAGENNQLRCLQLRHLRTQYFPNLPRQCLELPKGAGRLGFLVQAVLQRLAQRRVDDVGNVGHWRPVLLGWMVHEV